MKDMHGTTIVAVRKDGCICLGGDGQVTRHPQSTMGKMATPEQTAQAICTAALRKQRILIPTAMGKAAYWMSRVLPAFYDRIVARQFKAELMRSSALDIPFVVLHPGSHMNAGQASGIQKITDHLNALFAETPEVTSRLLLETTAGQGSGIGQTFEQLGLILERIEDPNQRILERRVVIAVGKHVLAGSA